MPIFQLCFAISMNKKNELWLTVFIKFDAKCLPLLKFVDLNLKNL